MAGTKVIDRAKGYLSCSTSLAMSVVMSGAVLMEGPQCLCLMGNCSFGLKQLLSWAS